MAATIERLQQTLRSARPDRERLAEEIDATKPRYLFSALLRINCLFDPCNFDWIEPGEIHPVTTHYYWTDNLIKYMGTNDDETIPAKIKTPRAASTIARRIIEREGRSGDFEVGVILLDELTGLDAAERESDGELLLDIQRTLLPSGMMATSADQIEWLEHLLAQGFTGPQAARYQGTCERILKATKQAAEYAEGHNADVVSALSQRAMGTLGYHNRASTEDARIIAWAGYEVPQLSSPMIKENAARFRGQSAAPAPVIPQTQCENCGQFVNLLSGGRLPKICNGCGVSFEAPEPEEATPTDETPAEKQNRLEAKQAEMRARKGK